MPASDLPCVDYSPAAGDMPAWWVQLPPGPGYRVRTPTRTYGAPSVVAALAAALARYDATRGDGPRVTVADMSVLGGGPLPPHQSHQRGRDVDLSFGGALPLGPLARLLHALLLDPAVGMVLLSHGVQAQLATGLLTVPALAPGLACELQFPAPASTTKRRVRHAAGHIRHIHVRWRPSAEPAEPGGVA